MKFVSASFLVMASLGVAFSAPAQANTCSFPCFNGSSKSSGAIDYNGGGSRAVAVMLHRAGGHVGYVMSVSGSKVQIISSNHGRKVGIGAYSRSQVVAIVRP